MLKEILLEMPISNFKRIGDFSIPISYKKEIDRTLLTNPKSVEKIIRDWSKTDFDFDLIFINKKGLRKFYEIGEISEEYLRNNMKISENELQINPDSITIIFTSNRGAQWKMMTSWIIAHRVGHALLRNFNSNNKDSTSTEYNEYINSLRKKISIFLKKVYNINTDESFSFYDFDFKNESKKKLILKNVAHQLGSMKSARDQNLRNFYEFAHELFAQYIITGKIKLNLLPQKLFIGYGPYGKKEYKYGFKNEYELLQNAIDDLQYDIENSINEILNSAIGKIFVI